MKKLWVVLGVVVMFVIGLWGGYLWGGAAVRASYASKIAQVEALFPASPTDLRSLSGTVAQISGTTLTLHVSSAVADPFLVDFPVTRTIMVTGETKITEMIPADPIVLQREAEAYMKQPTGTPPSPFTETAIALSGIKTGDVVTVTADENILSAPSFTATAVQVQSAPVALPMPAAASSSNIGSH